MTKPLTLGGLLLLTTALTSPAFAQTAPAPAETAPPQEDAGEPGEAVEISVPGGADVGDIVVTGRYIPDVVRATPEVVSVLSAADIARSGDGDIAGALTRVTGLSVVGNGYVYVRGLGDRYSLALLNGSPLPSPEPLKRVVPLDIFPTSLVGSALVQKSYSVNYPGEYGGGVINLTTKAIPTETFLKVGGSIAGDTETTGKLGYTYYGSDTDWTGFDDGSRDIPGPLKRAFASGKRLVEGADFTARDLQSIGASLLNAPTTVLQRNKNIPVNWSADLEGGASFDTSGGTRLGLIAAFGYDNGWRTRDARQQVSDGPNSVRSDYRTVITENHLTVNGLLGLGAEFGEHKIRWTNLYIRDTLKQGRLSVGYDANVTGADPVAEPDFLGTPPIMKQNTYWFERQLIDTQFTGEFRFDALSVDLRGTYANSQRESPYERGFSYVYDSTVKDYVNNLASGSQNATVSFSDLNENVYAGGIDLGYKLPTSRPMTISAGYAYTRTKRDAVRRDLQYFTPDGALSSALAQLRPDYLVSDYNLYTYNIQLREVTPSGVDGAAAYKADMEVHGAYVQFEAEVADGVSGNIGVRYEDATETVQPIDLFATSTPTPGTSLANDYWLPAATVTWNFAEDMQLRVHASKTLGRPQFRELALQLYQDNEADRQFFGNPFLVDSKLFNAEARYEYYFAKGQRLTIAGFYKKIDNPIEQFGFLAGGGQLQTSFVNAPEATLYGVELEAVKYVPLDSIGSGDFWAQRRLVLITNYTFSQSKLKIGADDTVTDPFGRTISALSLLSDGASLTGQSDHLVNLQVGLENTERLSQQTLLLTYASDRVTNRGPRQGETTQPDIVERPGLRLDFVAREGVALLGKDIELKFEVRNITGRKFQEFQQDSERRILNNVYDVGTSVSIGASVKF